jgi:hypothetical protein
MDIPKKSRIIFSPKFRQILFIFLLVFAVISIRIISPEDDWICQDGQWVMHGRPLSSKPTTACGGIANANNSAQIFYSNLQKSSDPSDCTQVFAVNRQVDSNDPNLYYQSLLGELFKGPNLSEINEGYTSFFSEDTASILKNFKLIDDTAYINFADIRNLIPNVSASCGSQEFLNQIEKTLMSDGRIKEVRFAINNDPQTFYDWIQIGCDPKTNNCDLKPFQN